MLKRAHSATTPEQMRALIATAMRDHFGKPNSVCNHPDPRNERLVQNQTIASSIVDLTAGDYYVAAALPCESEYVKAPWNLYADGGVETPTRNGHTVARGIAR